MAVDTDDEIMMINSDGVIIRMSCSDISILGRITSGVKLMNLGDDEQVVSVAKVRETSKDETESMEESQSGESDHSDHSGNSEEQPDQIL